MFRISMIEDLTRRNAKNIDPNLSLEILATFLADESVEVFFAEECAFGIERDFIKHNRHLVERTDGIKIEVYSDEHTPPHFHIKIAEYEWSYTIDNCEKLVWNIMRKHEKKIVLRHKNWWKEKLIEKWNATRPEKCPVGKI